MPYVVGTEHGDGSVQLNGISGTNNNQNTAYNQTVWACDNAGCHTSAVKFIAGGTNLVELLELGQGTCDACHGPGGSGPTVVWPSGTGAPSGATTAYGSHLTGRSNADSFTTSTDWVVQCGKCHTSGTP